MKVVILIVMVFIKYIIIIMMHVMMMVRMTVIMMVTNQGPDEDCEPDLVEHRTPVCVLVGLEGRSLVLHRVTIDLHYNVGPPGVSHNTENTTYILTTFTTTPS